MEVDRVSQMGGVGRDATPAWQNPAKRRRKFVEEPEPSEVEEEEVLAQPGDEREGGETFSARDTEGTAEDEGESQVSFHAIA